MSKPPFHYRACHLCEAICGLQLQVDGSQLLQVRGDAQDPFSRGHICPKATALIDIEHDSDRLRVPHVREGREWRSLAWDEAFALAGNKLAEVQAKYGADAVASYLGNPNVHHVGLIAYLPALLKSLRSKNVYSASTVDQMPHQVVMREMYGHQFLLPIPDLDHTDYFLMLGANPVASNGSLMTAPDVTRRLKDLTRRGKLVVVDPRRTETAEIASRHHFIRPGSDAWFLIALVNALVARGVRRTTAYDGQLNGLDAALAAIAALEPGSALFGRTGIQHAELATIADELAAAPRAIVYGRMGLSTQAFGSICQWLIQLINLLTGNLDREGGVLPNEPAWSINGAGTSPGAHGRWKSRVRGLPEVSGELPAACLAEEIATPGEGQIKALIVSAGNPVLSTPGGALLERALPQLDFIVAIDPYINETTRFANLILPPASALSQVGYDVFFNAFAIRRVARVNLPVVPAGDGELGDWQIVDRLGAAYAKAAGKPWRDMPTPEALIESQLAAGGSGLTYAALASAPHGVDLGPLQPNLIARLRREGRRIECAPERLVADLTRLAAMPSTEHAITLIGRRHVRSNNSWMHHAHRLTKGPTRHELWMHPSDLATHGLSDGTRVNVSSASGEIETDVRATADLMPGVASLPHGFGHQRDGVRTRAVGVVGASYNDLSPVDALDEPSGTAAVNGLGVRVTRAQVGA